jgi:tetratricopeptide (TPR) repeat protein
LAELTDEQEFLQRSLADLEAEHDAGDIEEDDYQTLKRRYTARAAAVDRELTPPPRRAANGSSVTTAAPPAPARRSLKVPVVVAVVVGLAALAGWAVMSSAGDRTPGENITGNVPGAAAQAPLPSASSAVQDKLDQARQLMNANPPKVLDAIKAYDAVLKSDPQQPEALAYRGWLLHLAGVDPQALDSINKAVQADPSYPDAHFFRGEVLCTYSHDQAGAITEYQKFLATNPPADFQSLVAERLKDAQSGDCAAQKVDFGPPPPGSATPTTTTPTVP